LAGEQVFAYSAGMAVTARATLPRRDGEARAQLAAVAAAGAPLMLARDRTLTVPGPLGEVVPSVARGTVVAVGGRMGTGATGTALGLAAAATTAGEWAAVVDGSGTLGAVAAAEAGVDLGRFVVAREVPRERWPTVVAALLDGMSVVVAEIPTGIRPGDARRLVARARERSAVLVALAADVRAWPVEAAVRIVAEGGAWSGIGAGDGGLGGRAGRWSVSARGHAPRPVVPRAG
jgi:hypothetical protein